MTGSGALVRAVTPFVIGSLILGFAIGFILTHDPLHSADQQEHPYRYAISHGEPYSEGADAATWVGAIAGAIVALFSALLYVVTDQQRKLLARSTDTADKALEVAIEGARLTKASVEAMQEANRIAAQAFAHETRLNAGKLVFAYGEVSGDPLMVKWAFSNSGGGAIVVRMVTVKLGRDVGDASALDKLPLSGAAFMQQTIAPTNFLSTGELGNHVAFRAFSLNNIPTPVQPEDIPDKDGILFIEVRVTYDVVVGTGYEQAFLLSWAPGKTAILYHTDMERRLNEDGIRWPSIED